MSRSHNDVEMSDTARIPVSPQGNRVGGGLKFSLEEIFARTSDAHPIYEKLGGLKGIAEGLHIDLDKGASHNDIEQRRETFGANTLPEDEPVTFWAILLNAWSDHMILILAAAAIVSLIFGFTIPDPGHDEVDYATCWIEGFAILVSISLVTSISSLNDYEKELKFRQLTEENNKLDITVIRDGRVQHIDVSELVVGDVANINPGLVLPMDGLFIKGLSVVIDESSVTGENDPKNKSEEAPFFLTGTVVMTAENTWILVCAVGENSFGGKLLMEARGDGSIPDTPLQNRLNELADAIGKYGMIFAALLFVILSGFETYRIYSKDPTANPLNYLEYFILAVAIVCVAVPEGLPLAVTISLAYSQNRMQKDNNQVRRLKACETMGNATTICSDKTGTLTQNMMSVVQGQIAGIHFKVENPGDAFEKISLSSSIESETVKLFCEGIAANSSSVKTIRHKNKEGLTIPRRWVWDLDKGNKTDNALLDLVDRIMFNPADATELKSLPHQRVRKEKLVDGQYAVFPFTSVTKGMSTILKINDNKTTTDTESSSAASPSSTTPSSSLLVHHKGGADEVLAKCSRLRQADGSVFPMSDAARDAIAETLKKFASQANRNIGIAYQIIAAETAANKASPPPTLSPSSPKPHNDFPTEQPLSDYIWLGVLGIQDPLRPEVKDAVAKCQHAGVVVRMCTGDNLDTAVAIAKECGIYNSGDLALTGKEFRDVIYDAYALGDAGAQRLTPLLRGMTVLARSQPLDKQILVLMHMIRGEVVAVTGDGTNDAPALKLANVGFVMRSGTDIAVKSADIVLLDDNFKSVQRAVVWGRTVNDNIRKFLQLQLSVNVVCVALTFISSVSSSDNTSALTTVQLLWVNLIMDTFAALALATEAPNEECLSRGPIHRKAPLISRRMILGICCQAVYQLFITLFIQQFGAPWFETEKHGMVHKTIIFNIFVFCTMFNMFNARKLYTELDVFEGFGRSQTFLVIIAITLVTQIFAVELFRDFVNTRPLTLNQWAGTILFASPVIPLGIASRFIPVAEPVFGNDFDIEEIDDDTRKMFGRVTEQIEATMSRQSAEEKANRGKAMEKQEIALADAKRSITVRATK